jgi:peroxin-6
MLKAITRSAEKVDQKVASHNASLKPGQSAITIAQFFDHYSTDEDVLVSVTEDDFLAAQRELVPSVSAEELGHYERVRKAFEGNDSSSANKQLEEASKLKITHGSHNNASHSVPSNNGHNPKSPTSNSTNFRRQTSTASRKSDLPPSTRSTFYFDQNSSVDAGFGEDEDEYVIRGVDHAGGMNGHGDPATSFGFKNDGHGKKGKTARFGSATNGDEDLYQ